MLSEDRTNVLNSYRGRVSILELNVLLAEVQREFSPELVFAGLHERLDAMVGVHASELYLTGA